MNVVSLPLCPFEVGVAPRYHHETIDGITTGLSEQFET